jgi:replicative DNA helicase
MNAADISALARHLFEKQGARAIAEAAQKAASLEAAGDREQAKIWRQAEAVMSEMQGPKQG